MAGENEKRINGIIMVVSGLNVIFTLKVKPQNSFIFTEHIIS